MAGGASWTFLCYRWHASIASGDAVAPLHNTQLLFWLPLLLIAGGLVGLYTQRPSHWLGKTGLFVAFGGALVGAVGVMIMTCSPSIQDVISSGDSDCGLIGSVLSELGTALLYMGLVGFGIATITTRTLPRWNALPLITGLAGLGGVPVGYAGLVLGGEDVAQWLHTAAHVLFGLGWVLLGYLLCEPRGSRSRTRS